MSIVNNSISEDNVIITMDDANITVTNVTDTNITDQKLNDVNANDVNANDDNETILSNETHIPIKFIDINKINSNKINNLCKKNRQYHYVMNCVKFFCLERGFFECYVENEISIFSSWDDPFKIKTFKYNNNVVPFTQSNQIHLEYEMLKNPNRPGYFCITNIYDNSENSLSSYPIIEFILKGNMTALEIFEKELLMYLDYDKKFNCNEKDYSYISKKLNRNVSELSNDVKLKIYEKFGPVFLLKNYPEYVNMHWTTKKDLNYNTYNKIVVLLSGIEVIESYEKNTDKNEMLTNFKTLENGLYSKKLFESFGEKQVKEELDNYLTNNFFIRSVGKIYIDRLITSMLKEGLIPELFC